MRKLTVIGPRTKEQHTDRECRESFRAAQNCRSLQLGPLHSPFSSDRLGALIFECRLYSVVLNAYRNIHSMFFPVN